VRKDRIKAAELTRRASRLSDRDNDPLPEWGVLIPIQPPHRRMIWGALVWGIGQIFMSSLCPTPPIRLEFLRSGVLLMRPSRACVGCARESHARARESAWICARCRWFDKLAAVFATLPAVFGAGCAYRTPHCRNLTRVVVMLDLLMIAYGVGFFVAALFYVVACEKM
jgi:ribosomal protein L37AE/L43A